LLLVLLSLIEDITSSYTSASDGGGGISYSRSIEYTFTSFDLLNETLLGEGVYLDRPSAYFCVRQGADLTVEDI
jgi:hypothetical protein